MKVVYLVPHVHGDGGTEKAALTQAAAMADHHDVEVVSVYRRVPTHQASVASVPITDLVVDVPREPARLVSGVLDDATTQRLRGRPSLLIPPAWDPNFDALADVALEHALPRLDADVVITFVPALMAVATELLAPHTAVVHEEHRSSSQRTAGLHPLLAFGPRADVLAVLTASGADWLGPRLGASPPEVVVVPNALPAGYRPRSRLDNPVIVAAGRLVQEKQFSHLVAAFGEVADELPEWRLRIFGDGPDRGRLMRQVRARRLFDRVELPGPTRDMAGEWAGAGIAALSSAKEGYPLVLLEAMAAGVPVVSYDCNTGPRDIVTHGVNGILAPVDDVAALAAGLLSVAQDEGLRRSLGAGALATAVAFDQQRITARWLEILDAAVARRRRGLGRVAGRLEVVARESSTRAGDPPRDPSAADPAGLVPEEARREALALVERCAAAATPDHRCVPAPWGSFTPTVVVPLDRRGAFLEALGAAGAPTHLCVVDPEGAGWPERRGTVPSMVEALRTAMTATLLVEPWPRAARGANLLAHGGAVRVDFVARDVHGQLPRPVDPTLRAAPGPTVDIVVRRHPWARWALRSAHLFAPWARTLHVVDAPELTPDSVLAVAGLSEHVVLLPDGVVLGRPVLREQLFGPAGQTMVFDDPARTAPLALHRSRVSFAARSQDADPWVSLARAALEDGSAVPGRWTPAALDLDDPAFDAVVRRLLDREQDSIAVRSPGATPTPEQQGGRLNDFWQLYLPGSSSESD